MSVASANVLVMTHWFDPTTDGVVEELTRRDAMVFRCDAADFPQRLAVSASFDGTWSGVLRTDRRELCLDHVSGIYYRRPTEFVFPDSMSGPERKWAFAEARLGFGGLLASLPRWLNHPSAMAPARYKPVQLQAATRCGLLVPRTLLTNEPAEAARFGQQRDKVIYKPLSAGSVVEEGRARSLYATLVSDEVHEHPAIGLTAHLFQEWVEHDHAVRLTVIDQRLLAVRIDAHSTATRVDWRRDYGALTYEETRVLPAVRDGVLALMRQLSLRFAAMDFLVTPGGEWVFLELNPNGQWAWLEDETGLPIASAIADALIHGPEMQ